MSVEVERQQLAEQELREQRQNRFIRDTLGLDVSAFAGVQLVDRIIAMLRQRSPNQFSDFQYAHATASGIEALAHEIVDRRRIVAELERQLGSYDHALSTARNDRERAYFAKRRDEVRFELDNQRRDLERAQANKPY